MTNLYMYLRKITIKEKVLRERERDRERERERER